MPRIKSFIAALLAVTFTFGTGMVFSSTGTAAEPTCTPVDPATNMSTCSVVIKPDDTWLTLAILFRPDLQSPELDQFAVYLAEVNNSIVTADPGHGRRNIFVPVWPKPVTTTTTTSTTTTTTTTTTLPPTTTTTTLPPTTTTTLAPTTTTTPPTTTQPPTTTTTTLPPTTTTLSPTTTTSSTTTTTVAPTTTTTLPATTTTTPSGGCVGAANMPGGPDPWGGCWPGLHNTGVPAGVTLTNHTTSCTLSSGTYTARRFNCDVTITGTVTITNSELHGTLRISGAAGNLTISDSLIHAPDNGSGVLTSGSGGLIGDRLEFTGGNRSAFCDPCTIRNSYFHAQVVLGDTHASAIRMSQNSTSIHNTLFCEPQNCSADMTGYPDFEPTTNWLVQRNLFMSGPGPTVCAYGGNTNDGKPYYTDPLNATYIRFIDNIFRADQTYNGQPSCGPLGTILHFDAAEPTNVWQGNFFHNGNPVNVPGGVTPTTTTTTPATTTTTVAPTTTTIAPTTTVGATTTTTPSGTGWDELFRAVPLNEAAITNWFIANTGVRTTNLLNRSTEKCNIDNTWLNANLAGPHVDQVNGRWIVERLHCRNVEIYVSNVTLRDFLVTGNANDANLRGIVALGAQSGIIVEHTTLIGGNSQGISIYFPQATEPNQIILRNMDISGYRAGFYIIGGVTVEYGYVHDLYFFTGSHNTGASIRSRNATIRRSLITDGNSAAINLYAENTPYTGILITENVLRLHETDTGSELGCFKAYEIAQPGETRRVINNRFYRGNIGNRNGGCFTEWSGNTRFDGTPVN